MTTRLRKNRKKRGHVSAGTTVGIGKHRKHPGGRGTPEGYAPPPHPLRQVIILVTSARSVCGYFHKPPQQVLLPIVNVDKRWSLVPAGSEGQGHP
ncbi:unnamed protein product [Rhodiola kirilowii]